MITVSTRDIFPGILSMWGFNYTWHPDTHWTTNINSELHHCIILLHCLQELMVFLGLFCYHFCLCYHYCSIYDLPCMLSLSLCLSYFLPSWIPVMSSELLGFYMKRLTFYIHHHQATRFLPSCWRINQYSLSTITFMSLALPNYIQNTQNSELLLF